MSFHLFKQRHKRVKAEPLISSSVIQRKSNSGQQTLNSNKNEPSAQKEQSLQSVTSNQVDNINLPSVVEDVISSEGKTLDANTRAYMESRMGHDFSQVRVHTDAKARESTREVGALAYTVGRDVVFGERQHEPGAREGRHLLAHELTHVVQQERGGASNQLEQRADAAATGVMRGESISPALVGGTSQSVQMKPEDPASKPDKDMSTPTAIPNSLSKSLDKFGHNSSVLTDKHRESIDALAAEIAAQVSPVGTRATIMINGHTDTSGDEKYNESLGLKRANAVKAALEAALNKKQVGADRITGITPKSVGEKNLAIETADDVREPLNRRVVITVKIEGPSAPISTPTSPSPDAKPEKRKKPIDWNLPPDFKLPEESLWERMERQRRIIEEYDRKHPRKPKSPTDLLVEGVTKILEPIIKKLPKMLRDKAREGIRKGIEAGTEKACDAAIDASGVSGKEAEAMKAACKAALKTKTGHKR